MLHWYLEGIVIGRTVCIIIGCKMPICARNLCSYHYYSIRNNGELNKFPKIIIKNPFERFWEKINKTETCWLWVGCTDGNGYGSFMIRNKKTGRQKKWKVHRYAYTKLVGRIPRGLTLDHLCRVRACVNPSHLEPVTMRENILRGISFSAINAKKTHCIHG